MANNTTSFADDFSAQLSFGLDPFQIEACRFLEQGRTVLVAAPTGAGKTVVGEFAIALAMHSPKKRAIYTTPIKALSNQKFRELSERYGSDQVGLLTGDTSINSNARILVMTTEVLRNMIYAQSRDLEHLSFVVLDEVHYLADKFRGAVWEEVIIHLPQSVQIVALSATVSNADEFGAWLQSVRGDTEIVISTRRPVPLAQHALLRGQLVPLFDENRREASINKQLLRTGGNNRRSRRPASAARVNRHELVQLLEHHRMLPVIVFIFSRNGCEQAANSLLYSDLELTTVQDRKVIRELINARVTQLDESDLSLLGFWKWREMLERGIAAHHAGMLPLFKEIVEDLFQRKLLKVVFATETLALGINMPARTVVIEKLEKFNGEAKVPITAGEYTQLTGRAGRRGIDVEGHSVVPWSDALDPDLVLSLSDGNAYPLRSSFQPSYNMAINLIGRFGSDQAITLLEKSFAQFQADLAVQGLQDEVEEINTSLLGYREALDCPNGDAMEFTALRAKQSELEKNLSRKKNAAPDARNKWSDQLRDVKHQLKNHPEANCENISDHTRWGQRYHRLVRERNHLVRTIKFKTGNIATVFNRITSVLAKLNYLSFDENGRATVTAAGQQLKRIYGDRDLLVSEALRLGIWDDLGPEQFAAILSTLIYDGRNDSDPYRSVPTSISSAYDKTYDLWSELDDLEEESKLPGTRQPTIAICQGVLSWAQGKSLSRVLRETELAPGDFVRWMKQLIDLLDQLAELGGETLSEKSRMALNMIRRGIVSYDMVD